ncbi:MAG: potassium-transporting ATPase subunit C [Acidobacteria bacterium]|nr:MAG: potassium-transporting ATPase subunit C [Acidobacteriota bacterium]
MLKDLKAGFLMMVVMTVITGGVYPAVVTGIAQVAFRDRANGSLVTSNGQVVGSRLIGQAFTKPEYFHPRPSAAGANGYDPTATAGSNLGPTSAKLINGTTKLDDKKNEVVDFDGIKVRVVHYCVDNDIPFESSVPLDRFTDTRGDLDDVKLIKAFNDDKAPLRFRAKEAIPSDAVTGSASGIDPHISPKNADMQVARVAKSRHISVDEVRALIARHTEGRTLGMLGEPHVNVLELNLALDQQFARQ